MLAPGSPDVPMQLVDARDLAAFMLDCVERGTAGTFNATAPTGNATCGSWLADCVDATGSGATLTWVADDVLLAHEVEPWTELPLWMPPGQDGDAVWQADTERRRAAGMRYRPVRETVADTWAWMQADECSPTGRPDARLPRPATASMPSKEQRILAAWHAR